MRSPSTSTGPSKTSPAAANAASRYAAAGRTTPSPTRWSPSQGSLDASNGPDQDGSRDGRRGPSSGCPGAGASPSRPADHHEGAPFQCRSRCQGTAGSDTTRPGRGKCASGAARAPQARSWATAVRIPSGPFPWRTQVRTTGTRPPPARVNRLR